MARTKGRKQKNRTRRLRNKTKRRCHTCNSILKLFKGGNGNEGSENFPQNTLPTEIYNKVPVNTNTEILSTSTPEPVIEQPEETTPEPIPEFVIEQTEESTPEPVIEKSEPIPESTPEPVIEPVIEQQTEQQVVPSTPEHKYKNEITEGDASVPDKLQITNDDLIDITNDDVLGTKSADGIYVNDGILYNKGENNDKTIKKVTILDIPEVRVETTPTDNQLANDAANLLKSLSDLLTNVKATIPDYVEVQFNDKKYIISKLSPYILV